jgi:hypothetical protein
VTFRNALRSEKEGRGGHCVCEVWA